METSGPPGSESSGAVGTTLTTTSSGGTEESGSSTTTTGEPLGETLLDLFVDCAEGDWESSDGNMPMTVNCDNNGLEPVNVFGGGWRIPMLISERFGMQQGVLILRPQPTDDGTVSVRFDAGPDGFLEPGVLEFDYEFVNTVQPDTEGRMGFQVFLRRPSADSVDFVQEFGPQNTGRGIGHWGTVSMDTAVLGENDELVFFVVSNFYTPEQGVALYNARIVAYD